MLGIHSFVTTILIVGRIAYVCDLENISIYLEIGSLIEVHVLFGFMCHGTLLFQFHLEGLVLFWWTLIQHQPLMFVMCLLHSHAFYFALCCGFWRILKKNKNSLYNFASLSKFEKKLKWIILKTLRLPSMGPMKCRAEVRATGLARIELAGTLHCPT